MPQQHVLLCPAPSVQFVHSLTSPHVDTVTQVLSMAISAPLGMCPGGEHYRIACKATQWVLQSQGLMGCHWHGNAAWSLAMSPGSCKAEFLPGYLAAQSAAKGATRGHRDKF